MARNITISISKGIAIVLMVAGHAEPPDLISNFIYIFHMPLFFITAGYFFSRRDVDNPWDFCSRRFKGLYLTFLKWALVFLVLHNLWFEVGLLNEQFGNWTGGVTHPYSWREFFKRLFLIVTSMSGYDEFMAGAFWFFRGLLVASVLFLVLFRLANRTKYDSMVFPAAAVCVALLAFQAYRLGFGFKVTVIPNGGLRDIWGCFFFGIGVLFRHFESKLACRPWLTALSIAILAIGAWNHWCGMNNSGQLRDLLTLPLTGTAGFIAVHHLSSIIAQIPSRATRLLTFTGDNTLYVFVFHIISFKVVSALKILYYGLDWGQIGCHMVIHYNNHEDMFWLLYTFVGTFLPLGAVWLIQNRSALLHGKLKTHAQD